MNGAESLVKTLLGAGVEVCFANPGTSEMHFVAALDDHPEMRCVLCLFEGGATGAADGYARMTGRPAATLLHLAPGFGNGHANLHNARKAKSPVINIVGDHATHHLKYDAPLKGDIVGVAGSVSHWLWVSPDAASVARDGAEAIRAARSRGGQIATLILPANTAWGPAYAPAPVENPSPSDRPSAAAITAAAKELAQPGAALMVSGPGLYGELADIAGAIATRTGCRLLAPFFAPRLRLGAGAVRFERLRYNVDDASAHLEGVRSIVLAGSGRPVNFFAYPGKPSTPEPPGCAIHDLCAPEDDLDWTLRALADAAGVTPADTPPRFAAAIPPAPTGAITPESIGAAVAVTLPPEAILVNEAVTSAFGIAPMLTGAAPHDFLATCGGAIGQCLPAATGAAIACPDRRVLALSGDGSAMYTLQSLWTMARERLDVTVVIFANRGYQVLRQEMANVGVQDYGRNAARMFDVEDPTLDWVALAKG
ncbi:MAG: acetolactate synthase large subunit, partial [Paracoccaceae bacterium]